MIRLGPDTTDGAVPLEWEALGREGPNRSSGLSSHPSQTLPVLPCTPRSGSQDDSLFTEVDPQGRVRRNRLGEGTQGLGAGACGLTW